MSAVTALSKSSNHRIVKREVFIVIYYFGGTKFAFVKKKKRIGTWSLLIILLAKIIKSQLFELVTLALQRRPWTYSECLHVLNGPAYAHQWTSLCLAFGRGFEPVPGTGLRAPGLGLAHQEGTIASPAC